MMDVQTELKANALGVRDLVFIVISAAGPLLVLAGIAPIALLVSGEGAPSLYLLAGFVLALFAVGFTTMSKYVTDPGAFYSYITKGLGRTWGIVAAIVALASYNVLEIGTWGLIGVAGRDTFSDLFGIHMHWVVYALASIAIVWFFGQRSVDLGAKVLFVMLATEVAILVLLAVAVVVQGGASGLHFDSFEPSNVFSTAGLAAIPFAMGAFIGFEGTVIYRSESRDPERTIPRATYIAVGFLAISYCFVLWAVVQAFADPSIQASTATNPADLFFVVAQKYLGTWASDLMRILIVSSVLASLLAFHNAINRYSRAMAGHGLLPKALGYVHPRTRSPYISGTVQTVLGAAVVIGFAIAHADPYLQLLVWVNTPGLLGVWLLQIMTAISIIVYFRRTGHPEPIWKTTVAPVLAMSGIAFALYKTCRHMELLTGASGKVNAILMISVPVTVVVGLVAASWLRSSAPEKYATFGGAEPDDDVTPTLQVA